MLSVATLPIGAPGPTLPWLKTDMEQVMLLMFKMVILMKMFILMMDEIRDERITIIVHVTNYSQLEKLR